MPLDYLTIEIALEALGTSVIHFLWQGTLISLLGAVALSALRKAKPETRYAVACASLALCLVVFLGTLTLALDTRLDQARLAALDLSGIVPVTVPSALTLPDTLAEFIAWAWFLGFLVLTTRFALQRHAAHRLATRGTSTPTQDWLDAFASISARLGVRRNVRFMISTLAPAPMVVGCLRPIILVPTSAFTSLTHDQLCAVLAHELAHIRRHDHLINTAQAVIESLLFFHPSIWWISSRIRIEREYCCDDIAIVRVANAKTFAEALVELETLRMTYQPAALAANGGSLMQRITRILGAPNTTRNRSPLWKSAAMMASVVALTGASLAYAGGEKHAAYDHDAVSEIRTLAAAGASDDAVRMLYDKLVLASDSNAKEMKQAKYEFKAGIKEALAAGEITDEQAEAKYAEFKSKMHQKNTQAFLMDVHGMTKGEAKLAYTRNKLDKMVSHGEITQAHANEKLAYIAQNVNLREEFDYRAQKMAKKYEQKVADGKISEEEAHAKIAAYKKSLDARLAYHKTEMKLREQIASGEISQEQAQMQLVALKSDWSEKPSATKVDYSGIKKLINVAIENGQMTEEEAKSIYKGLKKASHKKGEHAESEPVAQTVEDSSSGS